MKWLKRRLAGWVNEGYRLNEEVANEPPRYLATGAGNSVNVSDQGSGDFQNPMHITLYKATGGRIIKFSHYDGKTHNENITTYVINNDEDFEEALGNLSHSRR